MDRPLRGGPFRGTVRGIKRIPAGAASDPASVALIADFASRGPLHINIKDWSIPVYFVDADHTPCHDVADSRPGAYGKDSSFPPHSDSGLTRSPLRPPGGDNHLCIIDRTRHLEWGMWWARQDTEENGAPVSDP